MPNLATYTYKTIGGCAIHADVFARPGREGRPAILWLHGGALMLGSREMLPPAQVSRYLAAGYTVVAADYRLAPESKLPDILADVRDAARWVREEGPRLFGVDGERLAVIGHSAGGYLALLAGCHALPRPRALVAFYGYGDVVGPWYSEPSPFYCRQPLVSEDEARSVVGVTPIAATPLRGGAGFDPARDRGRFYLYCRQRGLWPRAAMGLDPGAHGAAFTPFCPMRHVSADYPPTLLLHGDEDTDVPYEQSVMMARALAAANLPHKLVTIPGGEHGFDVRMSDPVVAAAFAEVLAFLARHV